MTNYYHGTKQYGPYFEGWYLKYQTKDGRALALIPALHIDGTGRRSASLQIISDNRTWWLEYPETEFSACEKRLQICMNKNIFDEKGVYLHIEREGISLYGRLHHGPFTLLKSDIMGPFRFLSGMECAHGVISMGHRLEGTLTLNGETMDFFGGLGYMETDRGRSFPSTYLWTQCAWQEPIHGSLMLSVAAIPLAIRWSFTGCICAVLYNGQEYRLATYRGAQIERWSDDGVEIRQGKYRLIAEVLESHGHPLRAPVEGDMGRIIQESLCTKMRYRFWLGEDLLFEHTDNGASFEYSHNRSTVNNQSGEIKE